MPCDAAKPPKIMNADITAPAMMPTMVSVNRLLFFSRTILRARRETMRSISARRRSAGSDCTTDDSPASLYRLFKEGKESLDHSCSSTYISRQSAVEDESMPSRTAIRISRYSPTSTQMLNASIPNQTKNMVFPSFSLLCVSR